VAAYTDIMPNDDEVAIKSEEPKLKEDSKQNQTSKQVTEPKHTEIPIEKKKPRTFLS
jgi:translation elongation factor EF-1beta